MVAGRRAKVAPASAAELRLAARQKAVVVQPPVKVIAKKKQPVKKQVVPQPPSEDEGDEGEIDEEIEEIEVQPPVAKGKQRILQQRSRQQLEGADTAGQRRAALDSQYSHAQNPVVDRLVSTVDKLVMALGKQADDKVVQDLGLDPINASILDFTDKWAPATKNNVFAVGGAGRSLRIAGPQEKKGKQPHWSESALKHIESIDFTDLDDEEFQSWLVDEELQQKVKLVLPDVPWAAKLTVEEGKLLGLDDSAFRPGQAFRGREFWR
ncbi:MAG: hypothetical protein WDW38_002587 [Sanguina aurantia]